MSKDDQDVQKLVVCDLVFFCMSALCWSVAWSLKWLGALPSMYMVMFRDKTSKNDSQGPSLRWLMKTQRFARGCQNSVKPCSWSMLSRLIDASSNGGVAPNLVMGYLPSNKGTLWQTMECRTSRQLDNAPLFATFEWTCNLLLRLSQVRGELENLPHITINVFKVCIPILGYFKFV